VHAPFVSGCLIDGDSSPVDPMRVGWLIGAFLSSAGNFVEIPGGEGGGSLNLHIQA
jgi:hypothetical protein